MLLQTGRNIRMGVGRNVRIYAQGDPRLLPGAGRTLGQPPELGFALHIEQHHAGFERGLHLLGGLAHSGEHHSLRGPPVHAQHSFQFSARDHVETASHARQQP